MLLAQTTVEPIVTIHATDPSASEAQSDRGTFTVIRHLPMNTPPPETSLLVFYQVSGTASNGMDYQSLSGSVTIPPLALGATIAVSPIDDSLVEGDETVVLQLTASPLACATCGYSIGAPSNAVVVIFDNDGAPPTNNPPFVRLSEPQSGDVFRMPANIELRAYAQDAEDHFNLQVEFLEGTNRLGFGTFVATTCPAPYCPYFSFTWSNAPPGEYLLRVRVTDSQGAMTITDPVGISVIGAVNIYATDPNASEIDSASNIDPTSDPAIFTVRRFGETNEGIVVFYELSGSASNGVDYSRLSGYVTLPPGVSSAAIVVQPIADNLVEGTETVVLTLLPTCPQCLFSNPMCDVPQGTNCFPIGPDNTAIAYIHDSDTINRPPAVRMVHPANGQTFPAQSAIQLVAAAQDPEDGYFVEVEFFAGTNSLGLGTFNPTRCYPDCPNYILTWSNVAPGAYDLRAKATDHQGAVGVSDPVRINVTETNAPPGTNVSVVTIMATDAIAVEGPFCRSNWWWTTSWNGSNWTTTTASGDPTSPTWRTNNCSGTNTATFVVRRSGPTNSELTVYYTIGGTASNGVDFVSLPDRITIAAGHRAARIEVIPIEDSVPERMETVVLSLQTPPATSSEAPAYIIGWARRAAAIIVDNDQPRPPCLRLPDGLFHVCHPGTNGHNFTLRGSSDLINWTVLCTNTVTEGAVHFVDPDAPDFNRRFYQVISEPSVTWPE